mmetsp:Transcript_28064/g.90635  ORF Transcript_28064/g.90635 Transcript_28064/m.90635 type:complete len:206 (+) Transcript_28064:585-1202(+)
MPPVSAGLSAGISIVSISASSAANASSTTGALDGPIVPCSAPASLRSDSVPGSAAYSGCVGGSLDATLSARDGSYRERRNAAMARIAAAIVADGGMPSALTELLGKRRFIVSAIEAVCAAVKPCSLCISSAVLPTSMWRSGAAPRSSRNSIDRSTMLAPASGAASDCAADCSGCSRCACINASRPSLGLCSEEATVATVLSRSLP